MALYVGPIQDLDQRRVVLDDYLTDVFSFQSPGQLEALVAASRPIAVQSEAGPEHDLVQLSTSSPMPTPATTPVPDSLPSSTSMLASGSYLLAPATATAHHRPSAATPAVMDCTNVRIRGTEYRYMRSLSVSSVRLDAPTEAAGPIKKKGEAVNISNTIGNIRVHRSQDGFQYWVLGFTESARLDPRPSWIPIIAPPFALHYEDSKPGSIGFNPPDLRGYSVTTRSLAAPSWVTSETANCSKYRF